MQIIKSNKSERSVIGENSLLNYILIGDWFIVVDTGVTYLILYTVWQQTLRVMLFLISNSIPGGWKKLNKIFSYNFGWLAVIILLLCNPLKTLRQWHRNTRFVIVVYFIMASQRDNRVKLSELLREGHKVSEVSNLAGVSRTTVYAIKERMDDSEGHRLEELPL